MMFKSLEIIMHRQLICSLKTSIVWSVHTNPSRSHLMMTRDKLGTLVQQIAVSLVSQMTVVQPLGLLEMMVEHHSLFHSYRLHLQRNPELQVQNVVIANNQQWTAGGETYGVQFWWNDDSIHSWTLIMHDWCREHKRIGVRISVSRWVGPACPFAPWNKKVCKIL